ncbi:MAG: hypothetical protein AVDCRST_MAG74-2975 [uncultured Pyrinomonadaceae bacterium]|uniref:AMIN domain-containing protein n=1 Tax=uncultured Pyrinomonadaceae bacterium TaxID=2283094 RepID=A0A6J4PMZ9_9BACT|nr:MAG: hypothetical protein AVDCRST_MAG74-2975 [uncultured Pyrinomonadaceae bacterium]
MKIQQLIYNLIFTLPLCVFALMFFSANLQAQSINQSYPTPITSNEISGQIPARDIGDARLTSYFYTFNAGQGDVFINVVTKNLNGDIDIFTHDNLRPLSKITIYADASEGETGRVIYLRQPAKLILRVEGRSPNDDAATYRIKFAGSFAPAIATAAANQETETPTVKSDNQTDVRVNSVGTIIEVKPKPTPKEIIAEAKKTEREIIQRTEEKTAVTEMVAETKEAEKPPAKAEKELIAEKEKSAETQNEAKPTVIVTDELPKKDQAETDVTTAETKKDSTQKDEEKSVETVTEKTIAEPETMAVKKPKKSEKPKSVKSLPPTALENIRLIVLFKDGTRIERPMSEVLRVGVDRGVLTVISKDGAIGRYSILDVEKMTIE